MKTLFTFVESINQELKVQPNALNYISKENLKKYLEITDKFLSDDSKDIINYLIVNNDTYISELSNDSDENALAGFYNTGNADTNNLKELKKALSNLIKNDKILEVPVFQTQKQFDMIMHEEVSPDYIFLNLESEKAQNELTKKYQPLLHKICRQYFGKSNFTYDELMSSAYEGFLYAMRSFGKKKNDDVILDGNIVKYTFLQYAAQMVRFAILDAINHESRIVRIPKSEINKVRKNNGQIAKTNSISGDKQVGINNSEDGNKTVFDFIDSQESSESSLNKSDLKILWEEIYKEIKKEFGEKIFNIWCSFYGINDSEKLKNKELAKKYNISNSSITYYCSKVNTFLQQNKKVFKMLQDVYELMKECLNEEDHYTHNNEPYHINLSSNINSYE